MRLEEVGVLPSSSNSISRSYVGSISSCGAPAPTPAGRPLLLLPPMGSSYSSASESRINAAFTCVCNCGGCWEGLLVPAPALVPAALPLPASGPAAISQMPGPAPAADSEAPDRALRHCAPPSLQPATPVRRRAANLALPGVASAPP